MWDAAKSSAEREIYSALNAYVRKEGRSQTNNISFYFKKLPKKSKVNSKQAKERQYLAHSIPLLLLLPGLDSIVQLYNYSLITVINYLLISLTFVHNQKKILTFLMQTALSTFVHSISILMEKITAVLTRVISNP